MMAICPVYHQCGFEETGRMKFDPAKAPAGWDYGRDDQPDIVFMALTKGAKDEEQVRALVHGPKESWSKRRRSKRYYTYTDPAQAKEDSRRANRPGHRRGGRGAGSGR